MGGTVPLKRGSEVTSSAGTTAWTEARVAQSAAREHQTGQSVGEEGWPGLAIQRPGGGATSTWSEEPVTRQSAAWHLATPARGRGTRRRTRNVRHGCVPEPSSHGPHRERSRGGASWCSVPSPVCWNPRSTKGRLCRSIAAGCAPAREQRVRGAARFGQVVSLPSQNRWCACEGPCGRFAALAIGSRTPATSAGFVQAPAQALEAAQRGAMAPRFCAPVEPLSFPIPLRG